MPREKLKTGVTLYYEQEGQGPDLILIAGISADLHIWNLVRRELADHFRLLLFDNRGAGRSDAPEGPYTIQQMAQDTAALMKQLSIKSAAVVGHSMGGQVLQQLCLDFPERVSRAVICTSTAKVGEPARHHLKTVAQWRQAGVAEEMVYQSALPWIYGESFLADASKVTNALKNMLNNPYPPPLSGFLGQLAAGQAFDSREQVKKINTETLVIGGSEDLLILPSHSEWLQKEMPQAKLEVLPACGHMLPIEQPQKLTELIVGFLLK